MKELLALLMIVQLSLLTSPEAYAAPEVFSNDDLDRYDQDSAPPTVFPDGHETGAQYMNRRIREDASVEAYYRGILPEVERRCDERAKHVELLQQQEALRQKQSGAEAEGETRKGNLAARSQGSEATVRVSPTYRTKWYSREEVFWQCIRKSGIPPGIFGRDRW